MPVCSDAERCQEVRESPAVTGWTKSSTEPIVDKYPQGVYYPDQKDKDKTVPGGGQSAAAKRPDFETDMNYERWMP